VRLASSCSKIVSVTNKCSGKNEKRTRSAASYTTQKPARSRAYTNSNTPIQTHTHHKYGEVRNASGCKKIVSATNKCSEKTGKRTPSAVWDTTQQPARSRATTLTQTHTPQIRGSATCIRLLEKSYQSGTNVPERLRSQLAAQQGTLHKYPRARARLHPHKNTHTHNPQMRGSATSIRLLKNCISHEQIFRKEWEANSQRSKGHYTKTRALARAYTHTNTHTHTLHKYGEVRHASSR
jgi:hypothetical protein